MQPMTVTINGGTLPGLLAIAVSIIAIWSFFNQRRTFFREQGRAMEQIEALKIEVVDHKAKILAIETKNHSVDLTLVKIDAALAYIREAVDELKKEVKCQRAEEAGK
jgi:hypothetical protein